MTIPPPKVKAQPTRFSARQGFFWWEFDLTWYGLRVLQALGLVRDLKPVPAWVLAKAGH